MNRSTIRFEIVVRHDPEYGDLTVDEDGYSLVHVIECDPDGFTLYTGAAEPVVIESHYVQDARGFIARELECLAMRDEAEAQGMGVYEYACQPFGIEWQREEEERLGLR